jgi:hypothetical protein
MIEKKVKRFTMHGIVKLYTFPAISLFPLIQYNPAIMPIYATVILGYYFKKISHPSSISFQSSIFTPYLCLSQSYVSL